MNANQQVHRFRAGALLAAMQTSPSNLQLGHCLAYNAASQPPPAPRTHAVAAIFARNIVGLLLLMLLVLLLLSALLLLLWVVLLGLLALLLLLLQALLPGFLAVPLLLLAAGPAALFCATLPSSSTEHGSRDPPEPNAGWPPCETESQHYVQLLQKITRAQH